MAFLYAAFDQLTVEGYFNANLDSPDAAMYSGTWNFYTNLIAEFDYTPVSAVPLPGTVWLFLSALAGLGIFRNARPATRRN